MDVKQLAFSEIENSSKDLCNLANYLHSNPELAYKETKAHDYICEYLEKRGFDTERHFMHSTGFRGTYQTNSTPHFVVLVEYDALPEIGHACGHNIIALSSIATAIGLKCAMENGLKCKMSVLGTPAEEGGGGKIKFVTEGIFHDVDLAVISHPFKINVVENPSLAILGLTIGFIGKDAHASINPWDGVNALDAAVLAYQAVACLRQQLHSDYRINGIISKGGDAPNIIPSYTEMQYFIRAPTSKHLKEFLHRIYACFTGAAKMTKCEITFKESCPLYENLLYNKTASNIFQKNAMDLGMSFPKDHQQMPISTDVGNVSHVCPTIHPLFSIGCNSNLHSKEFSHCAGKKEACVLGIQQAKAMTATLIEITLSKNGDILKKIKSEFQKTVKNV